MRRNWERERNYWLDHFGQYHPGNRRTSDDPRITPGDYVAIPVPMNITVPLNPPCLIWRWQLRGGGYGALNGKGAHLAAFEQTRKRRLRPEMQINHLCNRPFCIQPAHLYEGTPRQNSEDRQAELASGRYPHWQVMAHRFDRALTQHHWEGPETVAIAAGWNEPLECPHVDNPEMFEKRGRTGRIQFCANCQEVRMVRDGREIKGWKPCGLPQPCRCGPPEASGEEIHAQDQEKIPRRDWNQGAGQTSGKAPSCWSSAGPAIRRRWPSREGTWGKGEQTRKSGQLPGEPDIV